MHDVADEAEHRDAPVLDLRVAQPADRRRVRVAPEVGAGQVERVVVAKNRVLLRRQLLQAVELERCRLNSALDCRHHHRPRGGSRALVGDN